MTKTSFRCASHNQLDQVILVDQNDHQIGTMDKIEAHRGQGQLHRAISVYLLRRTPETEVAAGRPANWQLLIQQRSPIKIVGAFQWANTACGNVRPGESYLECAYRRLREELGIAAETVTLEPFYKFHYQVRCNDQFSEHEMDQVFLGTVENLEISPRSSEVITTQWLDFSQLVEACREGKWQADTPVTWEIDGQQLELAPWFVQMLGDDSLLSLIFERLESDGS